MSFKQNTLITDELYVLQHKMDKLLLYVETQFKNLDAKKIKRNRTQKNRCQFINSRRGKPCMGYVCKKSRTLCYAHHIRASHKENNLFIPKAFVPITESDIVNDNEDECSVGEYLQQLMETVKH